MPANRRVLAFRTLLTLVTLLVGEYGIRIKTNNYESDQIDVPTILGFTFLIWFVHCALTELTTCDLLTTD